MKTTTTTSNLEAGVVNKNDAKHKRTASHSSSVGKFINNCDSSCCSAALLCLCFCLQGSNTVRCISFFPTFFADNTACKRQKQDRALKQALEENERCESKEFKSFPVRLMEVLENNELRNAIRWLDDDAIFCIFPYRLEDVVLRHHFQSAKLESFTRKLNRWGFKRVYDDKYPEDSMAYRHEMFRKGRFDLLPHVNSSNKKGPVEKQQPQQQPPAPETTKLVQPKQALPSVKTGNNTGLVNLGTNSYVAAPATNSLVSLPRASDTSMSVNSGNFIPPTPTLSNPTVPALQPNYNDQLLELQRQCQMNQSILETRLRMLTRQQQLADSFCMVQDPLQRLLLQQSLQQAAGGGAALRNPFPPSLVQGLSEAAAANSAQQHLLGSSMRTQLSQQLDLGLNMIQALHQGNRLNNYNL